MEELRQEFLVEAAAKLSAMQAELSAQAEISEPFAREIFRIFHTLKGTSQTFNLNAAGNLAHELENLLQAKRDNLLSAHFDFAALLKEGVRLLLDIFQGERERREIIFPKHFVEKLRASIPDNFLAETSRNLPGANIPPDLLRQLSVQEKETLAAAIGGGKIFHLIEAGFDFADFAEKYKKLRERLSADGEIAANFPSPKFAHENKIGFQIFFLSSKEAADVAETVKPFGAKLLMQNAAGDDFSNDLKGVLAQALLTGEKTAAALGKIIKFEIAEIRETEVSNKLLKTISVALLHLVRNAVNHGIEARGKIKIDVRENAGKGELLLRVADDGRGIDLEKVRAKAIAENWMPATENPSREQLLDLVFAHGFSTSETISEISGRGVGLDAVKDAVERAGGTISLESATGKGTTFEIRLPKEFETQKN